MAEPIRMEGLTLPVRDVARSVAFYHDTLGFPVQLQHGTTFALIRIGEGTIGLLSQAVPGAAPASAWTAEQCSALHLEEKGFSPPHPLDAQAGGRRFRL